MSGTSDQIVAYVEDAVARTQDEPEWIVEYVRRVVAAPDTDFSRLCARLETRIVELSEAAKLRPDHAKLGRGIKAMRKVAQLLLPSTTEAELADLAKKIRVCVEKADNYAVTAGQHLRDARERCRAIGRDFNKWCAEANLGIKRSRIYQLMGPDPVTAERRNENHSAEPGNVQSVDVVQLASVEQSRLPAPQQVGQEGTAVDDLPETAAAAPEAVTPAPVASSDADSAPARTPTADQQCASLGVLWNHVSPDAREKFMDQHSPELFTPATMVRAIRQWDANRSRKLWTFCGQFWGDQMLQCLQKLSLFQSKVTEMIGPPSADQPAELAVAPEMANAVEPTSPAPASGNGADPPTPTPLDRATELLRQAGAEGLAGTALYAKGGIYGATLEEGLAQGIFRLEHGVYYLAG